jgi:hypothetical protein
MVLIKMPLARVAVSPDLGMIAVPSNLKTSAVLTGKLEPVTTTSVPARPVAGESVSRVAEAVTVKVALAVVVPAVTVMVWAPTVV